MRKINRSLITFNLLYTWEIPKKTEELPGMFQTTTLFIIFSQRQRKNLWVRQNMSFIKVIFILGNDPNFVCMNKQKNFMYILFKKYITDKFNLLNNHFKQYDGS